MRRRPAPRRVTDLGLALGVLVAVLGASPAAAQAPPTAPGPFAIDFQGAMASIPSDVGFYPPVPSGTIVPSRGFGLNVGGHVYLFSLGPSRVGVGASLLRARGTASEPVAATTAAGTPPSKPDVAASVTAIAPQLSLNFGHAEGWSYVSAGFGRGRVRSTTSAFGSGTAAKPEAALEGKSASSLNFGFGARWFTSRHMAFSFDVRFHMLSTTPKTTLTVGSVGISLK